MPSQLLIPIDANHGKGRRARRLQQVLVMVLCLLNGIVTASGFATATEQEDFFESKIRPVLVGTCFHCHGDVQVSGELRVDSVESLLKGGDSGPAIVPGKPDESLLIRAIQRQGDVSAMPPEEKAALTGEQVADFVTWIKAGAVWPTNSKRFAATRHWAFEPVASAAAVPEVQDKAWAKSEIDAFIRARQESAGIVPAPPADRRTWIRRAAFDLTGLPPTPEEVAAFECDPSPQAFETVVDRLLATPQYGERWGRHWLDVVRYADTAGETADYPVREAWKYRNYVIQAFNDDKPYNDFLREQVAGDLLAADGPREKFAERVTATGFIAISRRFGFDSINYHHLCIQDTIDTLGQSVLGLTLGCARCHDHKYDPVSTADYYALYGIFSSTKYAFPGDEQTKRPRDFVPLIPAAEAAELQQRHDAQIAALDAQIKQHETDKNQAATDLASLVGLDGDFEAQTADQGPQKPWGFLDGAIVRAGAQSPFSNVYRSGLGGVSFPGDARNNAIGQTLTPAHKAADTPLLYFNVDFRSGPDAKGETGSYRFYLGHGPGPSAAVEFFANATTFFIRNGGTIEEIARLEPGAWYNVQLTLDLEKRIFSGSFGRPGDVTLLKEKAFHPTWDGTIDNFFVDGYGHIGGVKPAHDVDNVAIRTSAMLPVGESVESNAADEAVLARRQRVGELQARLTEADRHLATLAQEKGTLAERGAFEVAYGIAEGTSKNAQIQKRGEPLTLGEEVPRRFLKILGGDPVPPEESGSGRRQLAEWLTRPENPLTARVIVNRIWQHHFGAGLVGTENDFGIRGKPPTHPELLDYLAARFVASGWSIKSLHRELMLSSTYRQSSKFDAASAARDGTNELLWRFNRRRLDAEELRDSLLALGGDLDRSMGGEHPFPPPSQWGFTQHNPFAASYDTNRRSVYLMTQRSTRHPLLALFDGADANVSTAERIPTTVPTQALFWMNDPLVHAQSIAMARRLISDRPDASQRVRWAYQQALSREPTEEELPAAVAFVEAYARQLASTGMPAQQHEEQAWGAFVHTLFASNEFLYVD